MKKLGIENKSWNNLDMVETTNIKKKAHVDKNPMVFVNSPLFLNSKRYVFQRKDNRYAFPGMLKQAWEDIYHKQFKEADSLLDKILEYWSCSSTLYLAKFVVSLFEDKEAYSYLEKSIYYKKGEKEDDEYRLYLEFYQKMDKDDAETLLEYLSPKKKIIAFNKKSYNGKYLEFLNALESNEFKKATQALEQCRKMKPDYLPLEIADKLLWLLKNRLQEKEEQRKKQEKELEQARCQNFVTSIKDRNLKGAKETLKLILGYRELAHQNNYIYYLFLELIETVEMMISDNTFELIPVSYVYHKGNDSFYTFLEAISLGDFETALEYGKKCKGKVLDSDNPMIKVGVYVSLLEYLLEEKEEKQKEIHNIYLMIQKNIEKGFYRHALELYQSHQEVLKSYQAPLVLDLFTSAILLEKEERKIEPEELEEIPIEVQNQDSMEEESIESKLEEIPAINTVEKKEEVFYPVEPLLTHIEPTQEYFLYFVRCLEEQKYEDAKYWLTQYGQLIHRYHMNKRLDHYYYYTEVSYMESMGSKTMLSKKEELYQFAYNAMRNHQYENALVYLDYYERLNSSRNSKEYLLKGYIEKQMGKYESAIQSFIQVNSISANPDAYYFLGEIYYQQHKWNDAIFCYLTYHEFYPNENAAVYLNLSECYRKIGKSAKVVKYLKMAEEVHKVQKKDYYLKGRILKAEWIHNRKKEKFLLDKEKKEGKMKLEK